jgi:hypothetical protein
MALSTAGHATLYVQDSDECTGGCGINTGNTVNVTGSGPTLDITAHLATGWSFIQTGNHQSFDFSLNGIPSVTGVINTATTTDAANWAFINSSGTTVTGSATPFADDGLTIPPFGYALNHTTSGNNVDGNNLEFTISASGLTQNSFNFLLGGNPAAVFAADVLSPNGNTGVIDFGLAAVPAPLIGHGLLVMLAVGGVLFGGKLLERSKQRGSLKTA